MKNMFDILCQLTENKYLNKYLIYFSSRLFLSGKSYSGINDELIMVSIGMAIAIAVLISLALCYIVREKCQKHREYYVTA